MDAEQVFKALADHHRRHLLDLLSTQDGQSLNELCAHLPMTRIGVMKHLRILEEAGLITTRKVGRERLHYLNPAPLRGVVEWAERYRRHWDERMDRLEEYLAELQQQAQVTPQEAAQAGRQATRELATSEQAATGQAGTGQTSTEETKEQTNDNQE